MKGREKLISVITPAYNNPDTLKKFLEAISDNRKLCSDHFEVIVVDDCSIKDLKGVVEKFKGVTYVRLDRHLGPAKARNRGAEESRGEYLIFFDSDVVPREDALNIFMKDFRKGEIAVAGEYDIEPIEDSFFARFKSILNESWLPREQYVSVFALRAAGIKKEIFEKMSGFNENIKTASVEDFEFGRRLSEIGVKIFYDPSIIVKHHHPGFIKQVKLFYLRAKDWAELFLEKGARFDNWCASPSEGMSSIAGFIFLLCLSASFFIRTPLLLIALLVSFIGYLLTNINFIRVVSRRRGLWFIPLALIIKLPLAFMITLGVLAGFCNFMRGYIKRVARYESR